MNFAKYTAVATLVFLTSSFANASYPISTFATIEKMCAKDIKLPEIINYYTPFKTDLESHKVSGAREISTIVRAMETYMQKIRQPQNMSRDFSAYASCLNETLGIQIGKLSGLKLSVEMNRRLLRLLPKMVDTGTPGLVSSFWRLYAIVEKALANQDGGMPKSVQKTLPLGVNSVLSLDVIVLQYEVNPESVDISSVLRVLNTFFVERGRHKPSFVLYNENNGEYFRQEKLLAVAESIVKGRSGNCSKLLALKNVPD